ncbi:uncharacterized protein LOC115045787 [Echeneis naucrates]|uniref:uncharacterized protein LOC115045787 n=1 Tax=Echeneis naucrates TaxID=173247 RepID=UPI001113A25B|nr:uncharacterized protein LOC115045787 [Echeneis naucrates]
MKILCLILLLRASVQLQCDKKKITAHVGGEFTLKCDYNTKSFLFSKKYWCRGPSGHTCVIVMDSEQVHKSSDRTHILDTPRYGLFVKVTQLQFEDAGTYWVGIDKIYADIMTSVVVVITEVPVSKPKVWPTSSLVTRPTCWGASVTVRCSCTKGTAVHFAWYKHTHHEDLLLHLSSDLHLHCSTVEGESQYYCVASNDVSREQSKVISVQALVPADSNCIYAVNMEGQPIYDCADRMTTTSPETSPVPTCPTTEPLKIHTDSGDWSSSLNHTLQDLFLSRSKTGLPLWLTLLRWGSFAFLLIFLCIVHECTKARHRKRPKRKRKVLFKPLPNLAA